MKQRDLEAISSIVDKNRTVLGDNIKSICILSPTKQETDLLRALFPQAEIAESNKTLWNVEDNKSETKYDLTIAANVFMGVKQVSIAIENIMASTKHFILQDLIRSWRNGDRELAVEDGDITRFSFLQANHHARIPDPFIMDAVPNIKDVVFYDDAPGYRKHDNREMDALKFVVLISSVEEKAKLKQKVKTTKVDDVV